MSEELLGQVVMWGGPRGGPRKPYGFIEYEKSGESCRMFYLRESCRPDVIGRISDCFVVGTLVKFSIERRLHPGDGQLIAVDVCPIFREEFTGDVEAYRETSQIIRWVVDQKNGFVVRPCSEQIYFQAGDVVPGHESQFRKLEVGCWIYHGIASKIVNEELKFRAVNIECYNDAEQERLRTGLPLEESAVESTPAPVLEQPVLPLAPESALLKPERRNKTLLELIREDRNGTSEH